MKRLFAILCTTLCLVGCTVENPEIDKVNAQKEIYWASFEDFSETSRTYLDENVKLLWHADDRISLFRTTFNEEFEFTGETGANSGGFEEVTSDNYVTGNAVSTNYAVYPYSETNALSNSEVISLTMPAVQQYAANSFGKGANTMVAASESSTSKLLPFRNVGGYLIIKLYGENTTIKSIALSGNNNEVIAGAAISQAKYGYLPTLTMSEEGTKIITLDCGTEGVTISSDSENPTSFWMVVPPITFENGFTLTITDINDNTTTKSTSKSQTIERNAVKSMAAFQSTFEGETEDPEEPETPASPANNEIWYTNGSTTVPTEPLRTNAFGATYLSNVYNIEKECWIMTFDTDVTQIGTEAFRECWKLTSISLPKSIRIIGTQAFSGCSYLESVIMREGVISIESYAFKRCRTIEQITIPNSVTSIGSSVFYSCESLYDITLGNSIETIGSWAFVPCNKLKSIVIPESVKTVGHIMFSYGLEEITFKSIIPPGFVWEGAYPFGDSLPLVIYVPEESLDDYKTADVWNKYAELMRPIVSE